MALVTVYAFTIYNPKNDTHENARGMAPEDARQRLAAQTDPATRVAAADVVVRNDGTLAELRSQIDSLIEEIESKANDES